MTQLLRIKTLCWDKQQYELFDNESNTYIQNHFSAGGSGFVFRGWQENETLMNRGFETMKTLSNENVKVLLAFSEMNSKKLSIQNFSKTTSLSDRLNNIDYLNRMTSGSKCPEVNLYSPPPTKSKKGTLLRLVRSSTKLSKYRNNKFIFSQINLEGQTSDTFIMQKQVTHYESFMSIIESQCDSVVSNGSQSSPTKEKKLCRICFSTHHSQQNPLVSICRCSGSMKYIHYDCVKRWLEGKQEVKPMPPYCLELKAKSVRCEICLQFYPPQFIYKTNPYVLYELQGLSLRNYLVLEDQDGVLLIVNFNDSLNLTLGRGHQSEIKISEITVSREHAKFMIRSGKLFIQDLESKFGTLVKLQSLKSMSAGETLTLQSGRTKIQLKVHHSSKPFFSMCSNSILCPIEQEREDRDTQYRLSQEFKTE